jgi:hypothetical protein
MIMMSTGIQTGNSGFTSSTCSTTTQYNDNNPYATITVPPTTVKFPNIAGGTGIYTTTDGTEYSGWTYNVYVNTYITNMLAHSLIRREIEQVSKKEDMKNNEEWMKMQQMILSDDDEMFRLGLNILQTYTKYAHRLVTALKISDGSAIESILTEYMYANNLNFIGDII